MATSADLQHSKACRLILASYYENGRILKTHSLQNTIVGLLELVCVELLACLALNLKAY
jgi:hypothetical protein